MSKWSSLRTCWDHWASLVAEVREGSESGPSHLAEIEAEQRKLRGLRYDVDPRDALQIAAVPAGCAAGPVASW